MGGYELQAFCPPVCITSVHPYEFFAFMASHSACQYESDNGVCARMVGLDCVEESMCVNRPLWHSRGGTVELHGVGWAEDIKRRLLGGFRE